MWLSAEQWWTIDISHCKLWCKCARCMRSDSGDSVVFENSVIIFLLFLKPSSRYLFSALDELGHPGDGSGWMCKLKGRPWGSRARGQPVTLHDSFPWDGPTIQFKLSPFDVPLIGHYLATFGSCKLPNKRPKRNPPSQWLRTRLS